MRETTSSRGGSDVATAEPMPWRAPAPGRRPSVPRAARTRPRPGTPRAGSRFVAGVLLMAAVAGGAFGVEGLIQASSARTRVTALQAQLTSLEQRVGADEQDAASARLEMGKVAGRATGAERSVSRSLARINWSLQSVPSQAELAQMRGQLAAYSACIGQLRNEIAGLGIDWRIYPSRPTADYFKLSTAAPGSASCP
jgi:hypothetical protein